MLRPRNLPMIEQVRQSMGQRPATITADAGYWDTENVRAETCKDTLLLVSPDGGKSKLKEPRFRKNPVMEAMRSVLKTESGAQLYRMRKAIVEPVFGHIKEQRGFRSFRLRGLKKVQGEWQLICLTHNLLKLYRHQWLPQYAG